MSAKKTASSQTAPETSKTTTPAKAAPKKAAPKGSASSKVVLGGQDWTATEIEGIRSELSDEIERLKAELAQAEDHLDQLRDGGPGANGEDPVDTGNQAHERENELAIQAHATGTIAQIGAALARLDDGSYGTCENCGKAIAKERLLAFPKATTCIECKKLQERR